MSTSPSSSAGAQARGCSPAPPPLVAVARGRRDGLVRLLRAHGDEGARVAVLDPERALEAAVLAERHAARARHLVVLPERRRFELCFPRRLGMRGVAGDLQLAVLVEPRGPSLLAKSGLRPDRPRPGEQAPPSFILSRERLGLQIGLRHPGLGAFLPFLTSALLPRRCARAR